MLKMAKKGIPSGRFFQCAVLLLSSQAVTGGFELVVGLYVVGAVVARGTQKFGVAFHPVGRYGFVGRHEPFGQGVWCSTSACNLAPNEVGNNPVMSDARLGALTPMVVNFMRV